MQKLLGGFVVLALGIAIPASIGGTWFIWALWISICVSVVLMIALSNQVKDLIPWRIARKGQGALLVRLLMRDLLRRDLQKALGRLNDELKAPTVVELRAFGHNLSQRLADAGYDVSAKHAEVHLMDTATPSEIQKRRSDLELQLFRLLIHDEYQ